MIGSRFAHRNWGLLLLLAGLGGLVVTGPVHAEPAAAPSWTDVERLVSEQKYETAATEVAELRERARRAGDDAGWAKALIREVRLRMGLGGYETALRFLQEQPWPKERLARSALLLFQAHAYVTYAEEYAWEISQRERVAAAGPGDLKTQTREQIFAAATAAYAELWASREALGAASVSRLGDLLDPNDYPPEVRGTLRDAVSYLFVELLGNTQGWSPAQSEDVFELDLPALLKGDVARSRAVNLADGGVHPLVRIAAILDDLEAWHRGRGEPDAALETRLTRAKLLFAHFTNDADRLRIMADLEQQLKSYKDRPWWAMGTGVLAQLQEQQGERVRAQALAVAGAAAYPRTPGGQLCASIAARLAAPSFQLRSMEEDELHRRSLQVIHDNLRELTLRAYPVDMEKRLAGVRDLAEVPEGQVLRDLLATRPVKEWTVALPAAADFKSHQTYVTPPLDALGTYVIVGSARRDFGTDHNALVAVQFNATALVVVDRAVNDRFYEAQVLDGATGNPVAGAAVSLYRADFRTRRRIIEATQRSDAAGVARFAIPADWAGADVVARQNGSLTIAGLANRAWRSVEQDRRRAFVYTDRSIYRPGQKLLFKVIAFDGKTQEARFHVAAGSALTVSLHDPNGEVVDKRTLRTNEYGSAAGSFTIPTGRLLGSWRVATNVDGAAAVRVEEYKRPTFEVTMTDPQAALRLNRRADLEGQARYFFGLPVTGGNVRWRVTREPVYPFWWGWVWGRPSAQTETVATGAAKLDGTGRFHVTFTPRADERDGAGGHDVSYRYRIAADVTEDGGETRSADRSFRLGFVSVEARLVLEAGFVRAGVAQTLKAMRVNLDGVPRPGQGTWTLAPLAQPQTPLLPADEAPPRGPHRSRDDVETPGDRLAPRWDTGGAPAEHLRAWPAGSPLATGTVTHDAKGEARLPLPALGPGAYRVSYETKDDFGAAYKTQTEFVVASADPRPPVAVPAFLALEDGTVTAGKVAHLLVTSGFPGQSLSFDVWRDRQRVLHRRLIAGQDAPLVDLPIKAEDRGGLVVTLTGVRDHQLFSERVQIDVPWDDRALAVTLSTFRDTIRPGAKETWRVSVKAPPGVKAEAARAELLAYMYDRSLDLFGPHTPPSPLSLWPSRASDNPLQSALGFRYGSATTAVDWAVVPAGPVLHGDRLKEDAAYPIGGPGRRRFGLGGIRIAEGNGGFAMLAAPAPAPGGALPKGREAVTYYDQPPATGVERDEAPAPQAAIPLRTDFSETAFWRPHLLTGADGTASIEFTVPDSVTSWNVWVHAVSKELLSGSVHRETRSVKELMVRPNVPRFLREGDKADLKIIVNNASDKALTGTVRLAIVDAETERDVSAELGLKAADLARPFQAGKDGAATLTFALTAPKRLRALSLRATATAGTFSDGELRPLPILPSRVHLAQSRFVTLRDKDQRTLSFPDMTADPARDDEQLVVTVDAQLFTAVLRALPYLITYPYECTEQTLNRFLSSAIVSSVFRDFPAVARMAKELSARTTPLEPFDAADANRKLALEETPWLAASRGDPLEKGSKALVSVLDPKIAAAERASALAKLGKAQLPDGAFPWFPGGPADPYMTLYIMYGFAKAAEFKVDVPKEVVARGWAYLGARFHEQRAQAMAAGSDCCWEWLTFLNYVASAYPDPGWTNDALSADERAAILAFSFKHWKEHSPYLKGLLALTLKRASRDTEAKLVWDSVMDSAKTTRDEGTFWAPEDRSWLWYNDTIETQAFALRALMELAPADPRKDGIAQWLLLNKKLNQWKSTRATAEAIYALVHYLKRDNALGMPEKVKVTVGGKTTELTFAPDHLVEKRQIVIPGPSLGPQTANVLVEKDTKGFAFASATWRFSTERPPAADRGDFFSVSRAYFRRETDGHEVVLRPLRDGATLKAGDEVEVHLSLRTKQAAEYVHLRDPRAAGFEPENAVSRYNWELGVPYYQEIRDAGTNFFFSALPAGEYPFAYRVRASMSGTFHVGPATVESVYAPEFNAYSAGAALTVAPSP